MSELKISQLFIYPIKSARGLSVEVLRLDRRGPLNDRRWMIVDSNNHFLTQRKYSKLCLLSVQVSGQEIQLSAPSMPSCQIVPDDGVMVKVHIWRDQVIAQDCGEPAATWLSQLLDTKCRLVCMPSSTQRQVDRAYAAEGRTVGFADGFPLLIVSQASLDLLNYKLGENNEHSGTQAPIIGMERFRPNIVIDGCEPHAEDHWRRLRIGNIEVSLVKPCSRCVIPSIDPLTALKQQKVIDVLASYRRQGADINFGVNAMHHLQSGKLNAADAWGKISLGDSVEIMA